MFLAVDIGNSSIKFGVFDGEKLTAHLKISSAARDLNADQIERTWAQNIKLPIKTAAISSVVPELNSAVRNFCEKTLKITPFFVDAKTPTDLIVRYQPPEKLGADRFVAAFAAAKKYDFPVIVCDFGTAATIDFVNSEKEFCGGIIAPGITTLSDALYLKTSKLPLVEIVKPEKVIGDSTVAAIQSGIFYGYIGLVEGILRRIIAESNETPKIVATGGFATMIKENCELIEIVDEFLMLDGLRLISRRNLPQGAEKKVISHE